MRQEKRLRIISIRASLKSSVDRLQDKEKTGVFTGSYAINPINGTEDPNLACPTMYWLITVPARSCVYRRMMTVTLNLQQKFNIPIIQVIAKDGKEIENMTEAYTEASGIMINSGDWNGMESAVLKKEAPMMIEKMGIGKARPSTTSCVTGYSPVSVTGENRSRSYTARTADACRYRKKSFRCFCRM